MPGDGSQAGQAPDEATGIPDSDASLLPRGADTALVSRGRVHWRALLVAAGCLGSIVGACTLLGKAQQGRSKASLGPDDGPDEAPDLQSIEQLHSIEATPRSLASCSASSEDECIKEAGCRWFKMDEPCEFCKKWLGDGIEQRTGCRDWSPFSYCHDQIFFGMLSKSKKLKPKSHDFIDAVQHFHVVMGTGAVGSPYKKVMTCDVWCDSSDCHGQARMNNTVQGVNYGGRFVPESFLGLYGTGEFLFKDVEKHNGSRAISPCDISADDAGKRMTQFLDANIKKDHFTKISKLGFNVVRLPVAYWNLVDLPDTPEGPPETKARWKNLQGFMKASKYMKWIDMVFDFAKQSGLKVLMDLHSAPGGQSGNECTGCDMGPLDAIFFMSDEHGNFGQNAKYAVQAVEQMAKICAEKGDTCYGIELLNEPYGSNRDTQYSLDMIKDIGMCQDRKMKDCNGIKMEFDSAELSDVPKLVGNLYLASLSNKTTSPTVHSAYRRFLRDFYDKAIKAARGHMKPDKPIVIMDWPVWLQWWNRNAKFPYSGYGHIIFATHVYVFNPETKDLPSAQKAMESTFDILRNFTLQSGYELLFTEIALNSHGSGQKDDYFDYNNFMDWYVHQLTQLGLGSMIWNYDSYWQAWGSVASEQVGNCPMDWKAINKVYGNIDSGANPRTCVAAPAAKPTCAPSSTARPMERSALLLLVVVLQVVTATPLLKH